MDLTVIISYYKALDNLKLILNALHMQSVSGFEVILSEDDLNANTVEFLKEKKGTYNFPIVHLSQKVDNGFRKNEMLNRSIQAAKSERLVFIDGDCIPHRHFVKEYVLHIEEGHYMIARAVMLTEKRTKELLKSASKEASALPRFLLLGSSNPKEGLYLPSLSLTKKLRGIIGRNWGILKKHLVAINGFDEDYILAGVGEDVDIEWRLKKLGLKKKSVKNKAIVYHLYHPRVYSQEDVDINYKILDAKKLAGKMKCENGIS